MGFHSTKNMQKSLSKIQGHGSALFCLFCHKLRQIGKSTYDLPRPRILLPSGKRPFRRKKTQEKKQRGEFQSGIKKKHMRSQLETLVKDELFVECCWLLLLKNTMFCNFLFIFF